MKLTRRDFRYSYLRAIAEGHRLDQIKNGSYFQLLSPRNSRIKTPKSPAVILSSPKNPSTSKSLPPSIEEPTLVLTVDDKTYARNKLFGLYALINQNGENYIEINDEWIGLTPKSFKEEQNILYDSFGQTPNQREALAEQIKLLYFSKSSDEQVKAKKIIRGLKEYFDGLKVFINNHKDSSSQDLVQQYLDYKDEVQTFLDSIIKKIQVKTSINLDQAA